MLARLRPHLTYANVMATIAVFLGLSTGGAYATHLVVNSSDVVDESLTGADVRGKPGTSTAPAVNGSLTTHDISGQPANAANGSPFVQGSLTTWDIADGTLRSADVLDNSLTGSDVLESSLAKVPAATNADKLGGVAAKPVVQLVAAGATDHDRCAEVPPATGVFCTTDSGPTFGVARWQNLGGIWQPAAFYKDAFGIVHLEGVVWDNHGLNQSRIFILPAGYRPAASHIFVVTGREITDAREANGRIDVHGDGQVILSIRPDSDGGFGPLAHLSLDGISFRAG